jgi:hypothetical protein
MWYMRAIHTSTDVPQSREDVYAYLDVLANHEQFTDHMMRNWRVDGPERGVGARAAIDVTLGGRTEPIELEVVTAQPPIRSVERNVGAGGRRVATGTYNLDELPGGGTRIHFTYAWQQAPLGERLAAPIVRSVMRKGLSTALARLAELLQARAAVLDAGRRP